MIWPEPGHKIIHKSPVLPLLSTPDTTHNTSVIRELLHVTWLRAVLEVRSVQSEQEGGKYNPLRSSCAADHGLGGAGLILSYFDLWLWYYLLSMVLNGLDGVESAGEIEKRYPHNLFSFVKVGVGLMQGI